MLTLQLNGKKLFVDKDQKFYTLLDKKYLEEEIPIVLAKLNDKYYELSDKINEEGELQWIRIDNNFGMIAYARTLQFIFIKATLDLFKNAKINIEHSINKGIFGEINKLEPLNLNDISKIKNRMKEIINKNIIIEKCEFDKEEAIEIFKKYNMKDKVKLLKYVKVPKVKLYKIKDRYDYFYGDMAYSTGIIKYFDIMYYESGFILRLPSHRNPPVIQKFLPQRQLSKVFIETERWLNILDIAYVGALNEKLKTAELADVIRVSEALHEKKIAYIADMIHERKNTQIILIAGPSSSGKTTFAKRLSVQLRVNGYIPISISLDDYFISRDKTPIGEDGNPDFESIYALDLELFNENLEALMKGKEIELPSYNFITGKREWLGHKLKLPNKGVVIIEGIHGLNPQLTSTINESSKFKIYISALTQLNLDSHNRIPTTDVRKVRRMVRDFLSRGYGAKQTLEMWPSIKRGEEKNIFIYQEEADVMFNSTLVYELAVLKKYALEELNKIQPEDNAEVYYEASRLKKLLGFFDDIDKIKVPENSILREFIGGSCFYKY